MAQIDRLIEALIKHGAEALVLEPDQKPSLRLGGTLRPIVTTGLSAPQIARLVAEIAPAAQRGALTAGNETSFPHVVGGTEVLVQVGAGGAVQVRRDGAGAEARTAPPAAPAGTPARPTITDGGGRVPGHLEELLRIEVERGASDLHLSTQSQPMLRIDGELGPLTDFAVLDASQVERLLLGIAPERNRVEFAADGDTDFAHEIPGLCRFRCNLFRDRKGPGGVFRVIPSKILTVDDLAISKEIRDLCYLTKGLVLVTGPTGSGKSTTLTALIDLINSRRSDHVITIEDPIEFVHENRRCLVNQRQVYMHTGSFKRALRAALREDPDIVLVGEMRDLETVAIAMETAETGHLVFGTLHTSSAISTIDRLVDQFPSDQQEQVRVMLAESLRAVISQVLCRKIGGGRVAALEVLMVLPSVANLIREGKTFQIPSLMQTGRRHGMITLNDALLDLVKKGLVEPQEAYMKAGDKLNMLSAFQTHKIKADFLEGAAAQPEAPARA